MEVAVSKPKAKITKAQLEAIERRLSDRDKAVLKLLLLCKYLTTKQIQRLYFTDLANQKSSMKATNRMLAKLKGYNLLEHLERRIGGVRAGSGSFVWVLTDTGIRILTPDKARKRSYEPTPTFLEHTLAVAETYLMITEICRGHEPSCHLTVGSSAPAMELTEVEFEPKCWRGYSDIDSKPATLKPDLFAVTASGEYEDCYFFEVDLSTEAPTRILDKCKRYAYYYQLGTEQKKTGVFPFVIWLVPNQSRKESLQRNISGCRDLHPKSLFTVITPNQLDTLLTKGVDSLKTNQN